MTQCNIEVETNSLTNSERILRDHSHSKELALDGLAAGLMYTKDQITILIHQNISTMRRF